MTLEIIKEGLPEELTSQLLKDEKAYYFSYITYKGGCGSSSSREDYWVALTNKRALYKTNVGQTNNINFVTETNGIVPLDKISFIEVTESEKATGCGKRGKLFALRLSSSGGTINIPVPTKEKGYEIRNIYTKIIEETKKHAKNK